MVILFFNAKFNFFVIYPDEEPIEVPQVGGRFQSGERGTKSEG